ncbi:MAG: hypothetical protein A3H28_12335 [Acidobacteria bacterium RIFCSPLOWO2_02_FULL_61_28]|nr:MAG: hypothetical protein A3H28_12335 [Acidobacteria bacterium RIFCSPLOWO2_02_FULL_61_28]
MGLCLLGMMSVPGVAFGQQTRVRPVQQLIVADSSGKTIGRVLGGMNIYNVESFASTDLNMRTVVLLQVDQTVVPVMVGRDRFYGGGGLVYESENCMGTPFFSPGVRLPETDAPSLLPLTAIGPPGQTIYIAIPGAAPRAISKRSVLEFGLRCSNETGNIPNAIPTHPLVDLLTIFTPPFSLRAAP